MSDDPLTQASEKTVREMYAAAQRADVQGVFALLSEDLVVHEPSFLPYGGTYRGHEGFRSLFGKIAAFLDIHSTRLDGLVANGEQVIGVLYLSLRNGNGGLTLAEESIVRNGKVVQMRIFIHDAGSLVPKAS